MFQLLLIDARKLLLFAAVGKSADKVPLHLSLQLYRNNTKPYASHWQGACRTLAAAVRSMPDIQLVLDTVAISPSAPAAKSCGGGAKKRRRGAAGVRGC